MIMNYIIMFMFSLSESTGIFALLDNFCMCEFGFMTCMKYWTFENCEKKVLNHLKKWNEVVKSYMKSSKKFAWKICMKNWM